MKNYFFLSLKLSLVFIFLGITLVKGQQLSTPVPLPQVDANTDDLYPQKGQFTKASTSPFIKEYEGRTLFSSDFSNSAFNWEIAGGDWSIIPSGSASIKSAKRSPSFLISPVIELGEGAIKLIYREKYQIEDVYDFGSVWITDNEGKSWRRLHTVYGESEWKETVISLAGYQNKSVRVAFAMSSDQTVDGEGWVIENIKIKAIEHSIRRVNTTGPTTRVGGAQAQQASFSAILQSLNSQRFPFIDLNVRLSGTPILKKSNFSVCENGVEQTDAFEVIPPKAGDGKADIVFIQDNSGSMGDEIVAVQNAVENFVDDLAAAGIDFALGLTRFGQYAGNGNPIVEENGILTTDVQFFKNNVYRRNVASGIREPGWDAIVSSATQFAFRPGAQRIFIIITDEDNDTGASNKAQVLSALQQGSVILNAVIQTNSSSQQQDYGELATATNGGIYEVSSPDFEPILIAISELISNTYAIRYRSSKPVKDGTLRKVEVKITYKGEKETVMGEYIPGAAPIISLTQQTQDILNKGQAKNTSLTIKCNISDALAPFVKNATLFCKGKNQSNYLLIPMSRIGNSDIWEGITPASIATLPGLDFYITATDGNTTSSLPANDPVANPFQVAVLPNKVPSITFTPITHLCEGEDLMVKAKIVDNTNQLASAKLFYRGVGQLVYKNKMLAKQGGDNYQAKVNAANISANGMEYYIEAEDDQGVKGQYGTPDNPLVALISKITNVKVGEQTACNPADNTYTQEVEVTYSNPPSGSKLIVNGQTFEITASPQVVKLTQLSSNGNSVDVMVSFSNQCAYIAKGLFEAPERCEPTNGDPMVEGFTLVDAKTDADFTMYNPVQNGAVINLVGKPKRIDFRANTDPEKVGSVKFILEGAYKREFVENVFPYALFGDKNGDYIGRRLVPGAYTLTAIPYSGSNMSGENGKPLIISFEITFDSEVLSFSLINAKNNQEVAGFDPLKDGDVINLTTLPNNWLNIRADADPEKVGSVKFEMQGPIQWQSVENARPYALFMDDGGNYKGRKLLPGVYTLTATPYAGWKMQGAMGKPLTISFEVVNTNARFQSAIAAGGTKFSGKKKQIPEEIKSNTDELFAYPVPFKERLTVNVPFDGVADISLVDILGRKQKIKAYSVGINETVIEASSLQQAEGIYFVRVQYSNGYIQLLRVQKQ